MAENAVLSAVIRDNSILDKVIAWIRSPDAFWYKINKEVWTSILELYRDGNGIDLVTVATKYKEKYKKDLDPKFIAEITTIDIQNNSEYHASIVWKCHIQRSAMAVGNKIKAASKMGDKKIEEILIQQQRYLEELSNLHPNKDRTIDIIAKGATDTIIKGNHIIEWGEKHLDDYAGGITRSEYTALGGRPGNGKTTLVVNMIDLIIRKNPNLKVMLFNREMSDVSAVSKLMVLNSDKLTTDDFRKKFQPTSTRDEVIKMRDKIINKYKNLRMYDDIMDLDETIREIRRYEPDLIIDDYIQLIRINGRKGRDRRFEIEDIVNEYKWILKKVNASAVLVSQLSRDIEKRMDNNPVMADFAEGGTIEQNAETCMFVYYPYYFDPHGYPPNRNDIIVKKARYGKIGTYSVGFSGSKCRFFMPIDYNENQQKLEM